MPEIPEQPLLKAERAIADEMLAGRTSPEALARAALSVAAPLLAEAVASKILAHMDEHWPSPPVGSTRNVPRYYLRIAAQVAALAFSTEDDLKRMVADSLSRGDFTACAPEVPRLTEEGE